MKNLISIFNLLLFILLFSINLYADGASNDDCDGELISELHNQSVYVDYTESGNIDDDSGDEDDNYYFDVNTAGTLYVDYSSPNGNTEFYFGTDDCGEDQILNNGTSVSDTINVNVGDRVYIRVAAENKQVTDYTIRLVFSPATPPTANAGADQNIIEGESVTLDGSGSSDDGPLDYSWSVNGSTYTEVSPTITGLTAGIYVATLTVTDSDNNTDTDTMEITVVYIPPNVDPVADAGVDQTIVEGNNVALDGTGSTDDGTITYYSWLVDGVTYPVAAPTISGLTVGIYTATLTVTDNNGATDTDTMQITVTAVPTNLTCANPRSYTQAFYANMTAEVDIIGNSVVCQDNNNDGVCENPGDTRNNNIDMIHLNVDNDNSTFNHSSAELNIPADSTIVWAGLYWQGMFAGPTTAEQDASKTIKLKVPGGSYVDLTSESSKFNWVYLKETNNRWMYQGVAEITNIMDVNDPNGYYSVANLHTQEGRPAGGSFGAWSIIIVYENSDLPVQNVTVYDGYQGIMPGGNGATCADRSGDPQKACEYAQDNGCSIDLAATGVANPVSITLSGFLTPSSGTVNSRLALFSGEGDRGVTGDSMSITDGSGVASLISNGQNPNNDVQNATISRNGLQVTTLEPQANLAGGTPWINSLGADIDLFDITDQLDNDQSSTVVTMNTSGDGYFPGVFAFSTELYSPSLCYDYSYKQNEQFFTEDNNGSFEPTIEGDGLSISDDVTVEFFIQNTESSDVIIDNLTVSVLDINTTQASYVPNSTYVVHPNEVFPVLNTDTNYGASFNSDIPIGTLDSLDYFYVDYDLDIIQSTLNMPLTVKISYDLVLPGLNIPLETYLGNDMPLCNDDNFAYKPLYGNFNVENSILSQAQRYNLPTQTANRAGDFVVTSYDVNNIHDRVGIFTPVAVELIDAGKYHSVDASCREPDSALTPRVWLIFDKNVSVIPFDAETLTNAITNGTISDQISGGTTPITTAGEFYKRATENAAFRVGFNRAGEGNDIIRLGEGTCQGQQVPPCVEVLNFPDLSQVDLDGDGPLSNGDCIQDIDGNPTNTDKIPQNCGNAGNAGMDSVQLATCMECIYGYNIDYLCSRDNFAIRPESYRMNLKDQDQSDPTQQSDITTNDNLTAVHDATNASPNAWQVVAGYDYHLEINATNYQNDNTTPGYYASFLEDGDNGDRSLRLNWEPSTDDTKCNDTEDQNKTTTFFNGATALNLNSSQVGKYTLTLLDRLWTRVDHDPNNMTHHTTGDGAGYFITTANSDCIDSSSVVPVENSYTLTYLEDVSGCDITTAYNDPANDSYEHHLNINTNTVYTDIALRVHPYTFNHAGVIPAIGPYTRTNSQTFVYIDTPPTMDANDTEMSYNMNGTFVAAGYNNVQLTNFVADCYADNIDMDLHFTYNVPQPPITPFLSYSLKDHNTTDGTVIYRPASGTDDFEVGQHTSINSPLIIDQNATFFVKDMNGSITMDLGYNFVRTYNQPLNPRFITFHDFNLTYNVNPTGVKADLESDFQIFGNKDLDDNVTFVYGRAKPSQYFYDDVVANSILTPNSIVVYCDQDPITCSAVYNIEDAALRKTEEFDWYLSSGHDTDDGDGNITLVASTGGSVSPTDPNAVAINTGDGGVNNPDVNVSANPGTDRPLDVFINFGNETNRWLIYNPYLDAIPSPYYRVRFIGESDWAGAGDTGHTVGGETSIQKNRRLGW